MTNYIPIDEARKEIREYAKTLTFEEGFFGAMRKLSVMVSGLDSYSLRYDMNSATVVFAGDMAVLRIVPDRDWYGYTKRLYAYDVCKLLH
jgi:hypothetical protein